MIKPDKITISIAIIIYLLLCSLSATSAQEQAISFSIKPAVQQIKLKSGDQKDISFQIGNLSQNDISLTINSVFFTNMDEKGNAELKRQNKANNWFRFNDLHLPQNINIKKSEIKQFSLTLFIPQDTKEGDYYLSILFTGGSNNSIEKEINDQKGTITVEQQGELASLILVSVLGKPEPSQLEIEKFFYQGSLFQNPLPFFLKIKNTGRNVTKIKGTIEIKNLFGTSVGTLSLPEKFILAGSSRLLEAQNGLLLSTHASTFGPYKANLKLYDHDGRTLLLESKISFLSFSAKNLLPVVVIGLIIITIILLLNLKRLITIINKKT